jgi:hypothetical protein
MRVLGRRKPDLKVRVRSTGGSPGKIDVVANVSNVGTAPAVEWRVTAELNGIGIVHSSPPFSLGEGELDHWVPFSLERPRHGDLVKALNDATTLYGRRLTVRVRCDGREGVAQWEEDQYDTVSDAAPDQVQRDLCKCAASTRP